EKVNENKINEEDLFPNASKEDIVARKEEQRQKMLARLKGLKVGDAVRVKRDIGVVPSLEGLRGIIRKIHTDGPGYPIVVDFTREDEEKKRYAFEPEELEKVS
ncbi:MAG: hypothetical protein ABSF32_12910, partial [Ignavibacteria bacterium]